ncbi:MAG: hypothetical protein AAFU57_13755 [Bacteroidota bacterium]
MKTLKIVYIFALLPIFLLTSCVSNAQKTVEFTIKGGALVEALYINDPKSLLSEKDIKKLASTYEKQGSKVLAKFATTDFPDAGEMPLEDRKYSYILMAQWSNPNGRTKQVAGNILNSIENKIGKENLQFGFFAAQQDTPVVLKADKAYDFTSAWLISDDKCAAPPLMQVIGTYFGKIGPALQKYEISNPAFLGPHPQMPTYESRLFVPHMLGIFEWREFADRAKFLKDPLYAPHKDVRNSVLKKMDVAFTKVIL